MTLALPKPVRVEKPRKALRRSTVRIARVSAKRGQVIKADREWAAHVKHIGLCEYCRAAPATDAHHIYGRRSHPSPHLWRPTTMRGRRTQEGSTARRSSRRWERQGGRLPRRAEEFAESIRQEIQS